MGLKVHDSCTQWKIRKQYFNHREHCLMMDGTHEVPDHVEGEFVHLLCIYCSACRVGFIS